MKLHSVRILIAPATVIAIGLWTLLAMLAWQFQWFGIGAWEMRSYNARFLVRGPVAPDPRIVLVAIDERSILGDSLDAEEIRANPGYEWLEKFPYPRKAWAAVIEKLAGAGARTVVLDLIFSGRGALDDGTPAGHRRAQADNAALTEAMVRHRDKVVIGANYALEKQESRILGGVNQQLTMPLAELLPSDRVPDGELVGFVNFEKDPDGFIRRMNPVGWPDDAEMPLPFSLDALALHKAFPKASLPDPFEYQFIRFAGPNNTFPTIPLHLLFNRKAWEPGRPLDEGRVFRDRIVLVGPQANSLHDDHLAPFGTGSPPTMFGVEVHANALATLLNPRPLQGTGSGTDALLLAAIGLALAASLRPIKSPLWKLAPALGIGAGWWAFAQYVAFERLDLFVPVTPVGFLILGGTFTAVTLQAVVEQVERRRISGMLQRYVSKNVADEIIRSGQDFEELMAPRNRSVTVLFSDVRDFTTLMETSVPGPFVKQLNEYLTSMVACVFNHHGTLDKFVGDAVMAVFGSPTSRGEEEDAWCAVRTAIEMRERLAELNVRWQAEGRPCFRVGIGLNHGEVMAGDIGSSQKSEFGVIGDTVNVAARVESLTKEQRTDILITDGVYDLVRERVEAEQRGEMKVKGRVQPVRIYALKSLRIPA